MATGWQLLIGGTMAQGGAVSGASDYSDYCDFTSVRIYLTNRQRGSHATLKLTIADKATFRPLSFQLVTIVNLNTGTNFFAGIIQIVDQDEVNATTYEYTLTMSDLTRWLDHLPAGNLAEYPNNVNDTLDVVAKAIIEDWCSPGVLCPTAYGGDAAIVGIGGGRPYVPIYTDAHVKTVPIALQYYNPGFIPVSQAIDYLARLGNCVWFIDQNAELWFVPSDDTSLYAPLTTTGSITFYDQQIPAYTTFTGFPIINCDTDADTPPGQYRSLTLTEDGSTTISAVLVRNFSAAGTTYQTESPTSTTDANPGLKGDGNITTFALNYVPINNKTTTPSYMTVTATVNGSVVTYDSIHGNLRIEYLDGQPSESQTATNVLYINTDGQAIRFNGPVRSKVIGGGSTGAFGAPDYNTPITVVYRYYVPGYWPQNSAGGAGTPISTIIANREGFGPGKYMDLIADSSLTTPISLSDGTPQWLAAANLDFARYGLLRMQARFQSYLTGWFPGQVFGIISVNRGDVADTQDTNFTGWGTTFTQRFFVNEVNISIINDFTANSEIKASSNIWGN